MSNTEERDAMRDDGLIHARNGNLKSMQHATRETELTYAEVQESQIKRNEELFKGNNLKSDLEADLLKIADANERLSVHQAFGLFSKHLGSCRECEHYRGIGGHSNCIEFNWSTVVPDHFCKLFERKDES